MRAQELAKLIQSSSDSLLNLINDILDLTRIESGKLQLEFVNFEPRNVVEDALDSVSSIASSKGLEMICFVDPNLPHTVRGDADRLKQMLLNLLSNSVKFTRDGEVVVNVKLLSTSARVIELEFSVTDTGIGIPKDALKKLFNRFTQVDSSTTRNYGGTGLGLAISKQLAELMNGGFKVASKENVGSKFCFTVMLELPQETLEAPPPLNLELIPHALVCILNNSLRNNVESLLRLWKVGTVASTSSYTEATQLLSKSTGTSPFVIISIRNDEDIKSVLKMQQTFSQKVRSPFLVLGLGLGLGFLPGARSEALHIERFWFPLR